MPLQLVDGQSHAAIAAADAVLVASGTATLEVALFKKPMVIAYKVMAASWQIMRHMGYHAVDRPAEHPGARIRRAGTAAARRHARRRWPTPSGSSCTTTAGRARLAQRFTDMHHSLLRNSAQESAEAVLRVIGTIKHEQEEDQLLSRPARRGCVRSPIDDIVCGVDEAGRGPLAGPVFAAAVILDPKRPIEGLRDSKKLTESARDELAPQIKRTRAGLGDRRVLARGNRQPQHPAGDHAGDAARGRGAGDRCRPSP